MLYFNLFLVGLIPVGLSVIFYFVKKTAFFNGLPKYVQDLIIGLSFGVAAILGTVLGVDVGGATANARDAAPLCAGLLFGGHTGIIAGIIGGVYRFFATYWGAGAYSQLACSISTIIAGYFASMLRRFMFENKRPTWIFGLATGVVMEVVHMTILFITHLDNSADALTIVKICTIPMIICNSISVTLSIILLDIFSKSYKNVKQKYSHISQQIQAWLLVVVVLAYVATTSFVYVLQTGTAKNNAKNELKTSLLELRGQGSNDLDTREFFNYVGQNGYIYIIDSTFTIKNVTISGHDEDVNKTINQIGVSDLNSHKNEDYFVANINKESCYCKCELFGGYYLLAVITEEEVFLTRDNSVYVNSYMEVIVFAILFFIVYELIKKKVVNNIKTVNNDLSKIIGGDLSVMVNVKSSEEFFSLSQDINSTVETLKKYIDEAAKRIDNELAFAKNIQHSAIPSVFPPFPNIKDFDIFATMHTAKEVGGDFYDFYLLDKNRVAFLIADVSGKGIPAAMFMMRAKTLIKSLAEQGMPLDEVFNVANKNLCSGNDAGMFVTAWMGILDYKTGNFEFVNAGHNPPVLIRKDKAYYISAKPGFILGGLDTVRYKLNSETLNKGDKILLYTDGVTESTTASNELYSEERLLNYLDNNKKFDCEQVVVGVKEQLDLFVNGAEQFDDITMLCLEYGDKQNMDVKTFLVEKDDFSSVSVFIEKSFEDTDISPKIKNQILISAEEIYVNIANYAYLDKKGEAKIIISKHDDFVSLKFIDNGQHFNPLDKDNPDITLNADERQIGGLGIFLVKKTMDEVKYDYIDNQNILTIIKKIK